MGSSTNPSTCVLCAGPLSATYYNGQHGSWVTWFCPMCDVQRTPTPTPPAPADDASGAEAMREACVAPAHDMAPRIVVEPYGTSCWQVWLHIGAASWTVGDYRRDKDAAERFAEPLRHALRAALAAPLPARDDAVEEARRAFYEAARKRGDTWLTLRTAGNNRTAYEAALLTYDADVARCDETHAALLAAERDAALRREKESRSDDSRPASGHGGGK